MWPGGLRGKWQIRSKRKRDKRIKKSVWFGKGIALMCLFVCVLESTYAYM